MPNHRRPLWPMTAAALIGVPVLYVLSFGPACWLASEFEFLDQPVSLLYRPILEVWIRTEESTVGSLIQGYASLGGSGTPFPDSEGERILWSHRIQYLPAGSEFELLPYFPLRPITEPAEADEHPSSTPIEVSR